MSLEVVRKNKRKSFLRRTAWATALLIGVAGLLLTTGDPAQSDDRDLLRFSTAKPFVFVLLDTSASMNLKVGPGDLYTEGFGDDPDSRIYAAKEALFTVFEGVEGVTFGFATLNQDRARVIQKHWLYFSVDPPPASWPIAWPLEDPDGLTAFDAQGSPINDVEGDAQVFGPHFNFAPVGEAGTCATPLDFTVPLDRAKINSFAKLGADGNQTTTLWIMRPGSGSGSGATYRLRVSRAVGSPALGQDDLVVDFVLDEVNDCLGPTFGGNHVMQLTMKLDPLMNDFVMVDGVPQTGLFPEPAPGLWNWRDALTDASCANVDPFTGAGWEGNYDSGGGQSGDPGFDAQITNVDEICAGGSCVEIKHMQPTVVSPVSSALDHGDLLPWDWTTDNHLEFLQRLAPNYPQSLPNFGVADHLSDTPDPVVGVHPPRILTRKPIVAMGETPLDNAMFDFRCWYQGNTGPGGGCSDTFLHDTGWYREVACDNDPEFGCRRNFFIIISDGFNTCDPIREGDDQSRALFNESNVKTWALNVGDPNNCADPTNILNIVTGLGSGQCLNIATKDQLLDTLQGVLGEIRTEARAFAAAAIPTVRGAADQSLYVTNFTPFIDEAVWQGRLDAFLKPLPLDADGKPDTSHPNHLWDAAQVLKDLQLNAADPLGVAPNQRRVYYSGFTTGGDWPKTRRLFDPTDAGTPQAIRYDLWRGLGLIPPDTPDGGLPLAQETSVETAANALIANTLALKSGTLDDGVTVVDFLLGDTFHSSPLIVDAPVNLKYFALNLGDDGTDCQTNEALTNPGYRCFFARHKSRRRNLLVGSNDGMLHVFNAGQFDDTVDAYDNGTGHELFAYTPREILPSHRVRGLPGAFHQFGVDGSIAVADAFIDPLHNGTPTASERRWRTVAVTSLREGGSAYFALDITQPDKLALNGEGEFIPDDKGNYLPSCLKNYKAADCGPVPYPSPLWEFNDSTNDSILVGLPPAVPVLMDEDGNGRGDLGDTWSAANLGRIRIREGAATVDKYVAIFGGGMDPTTKGPFTNSSIQPRGSWIYMVDIETGKVIYKRPLRDPGNPALSGGSAPSEPAAVDIDGDGFLDRIYIGTTGGFFYRVDLTEDASGEFPGLQTVTVSDLGGFAHDVKRITVDSGGNPTWVPRVIFDANFDGALPTARPRALYQRPSVIFVAKLGLFAVAFGSGDRDDLWLRTQQDGRFYLFVDDTDGLLPGSLPLTEANFQRVNLADPNLNADLLLTRDPGQKGWYLAFGSDERAITESFSLLGVTIFSSYVPQVLITERACDPNGPGCPGVPAGPPCAHADETDDFCSKGGQSRLFVVGTTNANSYMVDAGGSPTRFTEVSGFVTSPYSEVAGSTNDGGGTITADDITPEEIDVMNALKDLFPKRCKFTNQRIDIKTISADTRIQRIAAIPVCVLDKNWKEF